MPFDSPSNTAAEKHGGIGNPIDFGKSLFVGAVESPWNGLAQLTHLPEMHVTGEYNSNSVLAGAGSLIGSVADFMAVSKGIDKAADFMGKGGAFESANASAAKMAGIGALYGGVFTPNNSGLDRLKAAGVDGITFGAMSKATSGLMAGRDLGFAGKLKAGVLGGAAGGGANVAGDMLFNYDKPNSFKDAASRIGQYAAFGGLFAGGNELVGRLSDRIGARSDPPATPDTAPSDPADAPATRSHSAIRYPEDNATPELTLIPSGNGRYGPVDQPQTDVAPNAAVNARPDMHEYSDQNDLYQRRMHAEDVSRALDDAMLPVHSPVSRALAENENIAELPREAKVEVLKGASTYLNSQFGSSEASAATERAGSLSSAEVNAIRAIMETSRGVHDGEVLCADPDFVDSVAKQGSLAGGGWSDYRDAYFKAVHSNAG